MRKTVLAAILTICMASVVFVGCNQSGSSGSPTLIKAKGIDKSYDVDELLSFFEDQLRVSVEKNSDYNTHPRYIELGKKEWVMLPNDILRWTVGFYPGILWYMYEATGNDYWKEEATKRTLPLEPFKKNVFHHDVGFMMYCSYGNGYRLTGNKEFRDVLIESANSAIVRYNPNVGAIKSWANKMHPEWKQHATIIDNMMNLELLFWATDETGDPKYREIAIKHADTTMKNQFRDDYSVYHVVEYDSITGAVRNKHTKQGYAHESLWARGQAWAVYGYTLLYKETGDQKYLDFTKKVTARYLDGLPDDFVPYWDYDVAYQEGEPRDASAAAVFASGLIELSTLIADKTEAQYYLDLADNTLASLASPDYLSKGKNDAFLMHSTGAKPLGHEIDVSLIYADYYFIEAILKRKALLNN